MLRLAAGRKVGPTAAIIDSRTLRSTPESGERVSYDAGKRNKGSKLHMAVNTSGHLLARHVTPASAEDRGVAAPLQQPSAPQRSGLPLTRTRSSDTAIAGLSFRFAPPPTGNGGGHHVALTILTPAHPVGVAQKIDTIIK